MLRNPGITPPTPGLNLVKQAKTRLKTGVTRFSPLGCEKAGQDLEGSKRCKTGRKALTIGDLPGFLLFPERFCSF